MTILFRLGAARGFRWREGFGRGLALAVAGLLILLAAFENAGRSERLQRGAGALPLTLTVLTDKPLETGDVVRHIAPVFITRTGTDTEFAAHQQLQGDRWSWQFRGLVKDIRIDVSPAHAKRLAGVRVTMGGEDVPVTLSGPDHGRRNGQKVLRYRVVFPESKLRSPIFDPHTQYINWSGDGALLGRVASFIALWGSLLTLIILAARAPVLSPFFERVVPLVSNEHAAPVALANPAARRWLWAGLAAVLITLSAVQLRDPYYFTQDDNFSQFLPVMLAGGQSLFSGALFDYNPYQLLGAPTVEQGTYALTYPGTYLAFALARLAGDENLTIEIFCMGHLVAGFIATWWAARRWGARAALAAALGVCFVLSGYALVVGRSWYYMTPVFLWLPLALAALHGVLFRERKAADTILLTLSLGILFHAGNAQMWLYAAGSVAALALLLWLREGRSPRVFGQLWAAGFGTLAVIMPLLLLQAGFVAEIAREGGRGYTVTNSLTSLLLPLPLGITDQNFHTAPNYLTELGPIVYSGPLLIPAGVLVAGAAAAWLSAHGRMGAVSTPALFGIIGAGTLLLTFGFDGPVWFVHAALPVLEKFKHPLKLLPFTLLLLGLAAVLSWERLTMPEWIRRRGAALFAAGAFGLMFWNAMRTHEVAINYYPDDPYAGVVQPLTAPREHEARLFPLAPMRSMGSGFAESRNLNFAMLYGELSLWGYDPIIWTHPQFRPTLVKLVRDPLPLLREYGVGRVVVWHNTVNASRRNYDVDRLRPWQAEVAGLIRAGGVPLPDLTGGGRIRSEVAVPGAKPLAFMAGDPSRSWPVTVAGPRVGVSFGEEGWPGGQLVLAFLAYPHMQVRADGRAIPFEADGFGRVVARVPKGARSVTVSYDIDWGPGLGLAGVLLVVAAFGWWRLGGRAGAGRKRV